MQPLITRDQLIGEGQTGHEATLLEPENGTEGACNRAGVRYLVSSGRQTLQCCTSHPATACPTLHTEDAQSGKRLDAGRPVLSSQLGPHIAPNKYPPEKKMPSTAAKAIRRSANSSELQMSTRAGTVSQQSLGMLCLAKQPAVHSALVTRYRILLLLAMPEQPVLKCRSCFE